MNCTACNGHLAKDDASCRFCGRVKAKKTKHQKALDVIAECEPALLSIFEELSAAATNVREAKADARIELEITPFNVLASLEDAGVALENAIEEADALRIKIDRFVMAKKKEGA